MRTLAILVRFSGSASSAFRMGARRSAKLEVVEADRDVCHGAPIRLSDRSTSAGSRAGVLVDGGFVGGGELVDRGVVHAGLDAGADEPVQGR